MLLRPPQFMNSHRARYAVYGVLFGCCFPIIAVYVESYAQGVAFFDVHHNLLITIIDTAPFFLGLCSYIAGAKQDKSEVLRVQFDMLAQAVPQHLWTAEADGNLDYINERFARYANRSLAELGGFSWGGLIHPDDQEGAANQWQVSLATGHDFHMEMRLRRDADQSFRWHLVRALPQGDKDANILKWFGSSTDIDDLKRAEAELQEQRARMISASKMSALGEMAGGVAHEINNPLAIISGKAAQLRALAETDNLDTEQVAVAAEKIEKTVLRISKIVKSLRFFARDGEMDPFTRHSVQAIIEDTLEFCRERFKAHNIKIEITLLTEDLLFECRPVQISEVILNLMNNAHDAIESHDEKWIELSVADLGDRLEIAIKDSGFGIASTLRDKIFQPFFTTKDIGKGTGLGLSLSKGIVEAHNGHLYVDPNCPHTRIVINLPKQQPPA